MNELKSFENKLLGKIRVILKDGKEWFIAKDISEKLDYKDVEAMTRLLDIDEKDTLNLDNIKNLQIVGFNNSTRGISIINESGLYHAIFKSRKESASIFRKWITSEVLPSIRATGAYIQYNGVKLNQEQIIQVLSNSQDLLDKISKQRDEYQISDLKMKTEISVLRIKSNLKVFTQNISELQQDKMRKEVIRLVSKCYPEDIAYRYGILYNEFHRRYYVTFEHASNRLSTEGRVFSKLEYIHKRLKMIPELLGVAKDLFGDDIYNGELEI